MLMMLTGKQIASMRKILGLSRTQFAARVGVSDSTICNWELDKTHPWYKHLEALQPLIEEAGKRGWEPEDGNGKGRKTG